MSQNSNITNSKAKSRKITQLHTDLDSTDETVRNAALEQATEMLFAEPEEHFHPTEPITVEKVKICLEALAESITTSPPNTQSSAENSQAGGKKSRKNRKNSKKSSKKSKKSKKAAKSSKSRK
jgi:hypothetical protein